jgi:hypothetical protein
MILCVVIVGIKYWAIGVLLGVIFSIGIFIKLKNDEKKAHKEYLTACENFTPDKIKPTYEQELKSKLDELHKQNQTS